MQRSLVNKWTFFNPTQIIFDFNCLEFISSINYQKIALITTPGFKRRGVVNRIEKILNDRLLYIYDKVTPNPTIEEIDEAALAIKPNSPDCILALGGGSSIDTAKSIARLISCKNDITLSNHFRKQTPFREENSLPIFTIPTTAGTGSEVTPFATVWDAKNEKKYSLSGKDLFPKIAFLDPLLTLDQPELLTIAAGLDVVSHALESIWNINANPITISLSTKSLEMSLKTLPELKKSGDNLLARKEMMQASVLAGLAISQTRTSLAHSISYPLTIAYTLPHGLACSFILPELLHFNSQADDGRLEHLAKNLGYTTINDLENGLRELLSQLEVPRLIHQYIPIFNNITKLTKEMITPGRADNNLRPAGIEDVRDIIMDFIKKNAF